MMLRFTRLTRSCHTQVARSSKRRSATAKKRPPAAAPPQTFREVADREWFISSVCRFDFKFFIREPCETRGSRTGFLVVVVLLLVVVVETLSQKGVYLKCYDHETPI